MLIVCPNLAIDHTIALPAVLLGAVQRTGPAISVAGGKGANIARACKALGGSPTVLGFLATAGGTYLRELFAAELLALTGIEVAGVVRCCTTLIEQSGRVSLLNEPGPTVTDGDWQSLLAAAHVLATRLPADSARAAVIGTGSLPRGSPVDGYARLVETVHLGGGECAIDASGPALRAAAAAGADLLCPNLSEATGALSNEPGTVEQVDEQAADIPDRAMKAAHRLVALGARRAAVTAGSSGLAFAGPELEVWLPAVTVTARNPIGAGDSLLAGTMLARERGVEWPAAVRFGMATAASSVESQGAGVVDPNRVTAIEQQLIAAHAATALGQQPR
ncbi:MAG: PfkB family carbohydrate kinase [Actinomycetota bacterium]|nr:PfkB family carbohydrate kinase [Actinomycetota bacterium]